MRGLNPSTTLYPASAQLYISKAGSGVQITIFLTNQHTKILTQAD